MNTERNSFGMFDTPISRLKQETLTFSSEDMERQFEAGAFTMDREEAVKAGFLNPYDDDTALVAVGTASSSASSVCARPATCKGKEYTLCLWMPCTLSCTAPNPLWPGYMPLCRLPRERLRLKSFLISFHCK